MVAPTKTSRVGSPVHRKGSVPATFSAGESSVIVTVDDATVTASSIIVACASAADGDDGDEMELDPISVSPGTIVPGVSFDLIATAGPFSAPQGTYALVFHAW